MQHAQDGQVEDQTEIIITATKREENVQNVPINVIALGTRRLDQLNISNFEDYTKQLPSVSFLTTQPGVTTVYMRGVSAAGGTAEKPLGAAAAGRHLSRRAAGHDDWRDAGCPHLRRRPDREPLGPQGTLYGASSEAGTIRVITNKPELGVSDRAR